MKTAVLILGFILLPSLSLFSQDVGKETGKDKPIYFVIKNLECKDCQGLGYLNTVTYDFARDGSSDGRSKRMSGVVDMKIGRLVCPYCGGKGKIEIREYKTKL